jgi:hypothetical protein
MDSFNKIYLGSKFYESRKHQSFTVGRRTSKVKSLGYVSDYCRFVFYASGRDNIMSLYITLNLLPRHDLFKYTWARIMESDLAKDTAV